MPSSAPPPSILGHPESQTASSDAQSRAWRQPLRITLALDDALLAKAQAATGLTEKSVLVREALKALIERESARRLARRGGIEPELNAPPRRRPGDG